MLSFSRSETAGPSIQYMYSPWGAAWPLMSLDPPRCHPRLLQGLKPELQLPPTQKPSLLCCGHGAHSLAHSASFLFSPNSSSSLRTQAWGSSTCASGPNLHLDEVPCLRAPKGSWVSLHHSRNIVTCFLYQTVSDSIHFHKTGTPKSTVLSKC